MTFVVGLTGGIGSGKTVVSDHFISLGVTVIDTDVLARQIVEPGQPALESLISAFGKNIVFESGHLNRAQLRKLAFANDESKAKLDLITHPAIRQEAIKKIAAVSAPYCLVVVPLLSANSEFSELMKRILVVSAETNTKIRRVQQRSGLTRNEVERIMQTQLADEQRRLLADDIIENNTSLESVFQQVELLHQRYLEMAARDKEMAPNQS